MNEYVVGLNSLERKSPAKPKEVTAAIRKSFDDAPLAPNLSIILLTTSATTGLASSCSFSLGTLNHASATGVVQRIRAVIRRGRMWRGMDQRGY